MTPFSLDPKLDADTRFMAELGLCRLLLMNDSRFPWLIMVPQRQDVCEIHELSPLDQTMLTFETVSVSQRLKQFTGCDKINVAALGNQVAQLHVHVIARNAGDAAWPGPVWGCGDATPYDDAGAGRFIEGFMAELP